MMLVNRLHKDMESSNMLIACAALMAACKLLTVDMIPAVLPQVTKLLTHDRCVLVSAAPTQARLGRGALSSGLMWPRVCCVAGRSCARRR